MGSSRIKDKRVCYACGSDKTYVNKRGSEDWRTNKPTNLFLCQGCGMKYLSSKEKKSKYDHRRLFYKRKFVLLDHDPRSGKCSLCGKVGITNMHHFADYHDDDPLRDTVELCPACHLDQHRHLHPRVKKKRIGFRTCVICKTSKTSKYFSYNGEIRQSWYKDLLHPNEWNCKNCHRKLSRKFLHILTH